MRSMRIAMVVLAVMSAAASAQDFRKVVEIVDEMETSLKRMIAKEQTDRKNEIASLRTEVLALRQSLSTASAAPDHAVAAVASIDDLARRMDVLEKRVGGGPQNADLTQLTGQLNTLVAELKKVIGEKPQGTVATSKPAAAAPASAPSMFTFSGQIRHRGELDGRTFAPGARALGFNLLRSRLNIAVRASDDIQVLAQVQDARLWGGGNAALARGTQDGTAKALDFHQAYFAITNVFASGLGLKVGRQEMAYGNERLISPTNWNNYGRTFDAARVAYDDNMLSAHLFTAKLVGSQTVTASENLHGLYATIRSLDPALLDIALLVDNNTAELTKGPDQGEAKLNRITAGGRLFGKPAPFDFDVELFHQFGQIALSDTGSRSAIKASLISAAGGLTIDASLKLRVGFLYTVMTGDNSSKDGSYGVFSMIFGSGHAYFGSMDLFPKILGDYGIRDAAITVAISPAAPLSLAFDLHHFRADRGVAYRTVTGTMAEATALGQEIDLTASFKYSAQVTFTGGVSAFIPGEALINARGPATSYWCFLATTVNFQ